MLLIAFTYILLILVLSTNVQFNFFVKAYNKNPDFPDNAVALSFDDGPVESTLPILDILERHNTKAVFFCIGKNIVASKKTNLKFLYLRTCYQLFKALKIYFIK